MLARDLHMTLAEMRRKLSTQEFHQWVAFYAIEAERRRREEEKRKQQGR